MNSCCSSCTRDPPTWGEAQTHAIPDRQTRDGIKRRNVDGIKTHVRRERACQTWV